MVFLPLNERQRARELSDAKANETKTVEYSRSVASRLALSRREDECGMMKNEECGGCSESCISKLRTLRNADLFESNKYLSYPIPLFFRCFGDGRVPQ